MTTSSATDHAPRVWPACLSCYGSGHLVGQWVDCTNAAEVTLEQLHTGSGGPYAGCEEIWCLDHENIPVRGEFGLQEAAEWGRVYEEVGDQLWPAVYAWVHSGAHITEGTGDLPSISDFEERYAGHWDSFRDYAEDLVDELGMMNGWPEEAVRYFNWGFWTADLKYDYTVMDAPDGGVFIFRNL